MPIMTMLLTHRSPLGMTPSVGCVPLNSGLPEFRLEVRKSGKPDLRCQSPSRSRATITWPTISPGVRLRTRRCVPVWQKVQVSVQPTWLDTHKVPRSTSGI